MKNDLLDKIERVIASCRSEDHNLICEVYQTLKDQQAEIKSLEEQVQRLQANQLKLRPMEELFGAVTEDGLRIVVYVNGEWNFFGYSVGTQELYFNLGQSRISKEEALTFDGWVDMRYLPREVTE